METWIDIPKNSDFSIHNIPFGIFSTKDSKKRVGTAIGDMILDLKLSSDLGVFDDINESSFIFEKVTTLYKEKFPFTIAKNSYDLKKSSLESSFLEKFSEKQKEEILSSALISEALTILDGLIKK